MGEEADERQPDQHSEHADSERKHRGGHCPEGKHQDGERQREHMQLAPTAVLRDQPAFVEIEGRAPGDQYPVTRPSREPSQCLPQVFTDGVHQGTQTIGRQLERDEKERSPPIAALEGRIVSGVARQRAPDEAQSIERCKQGVAHKLRAGLIERAGRGHRHCEELGDGPGEPGGDEMVGAL